MMRPLRERMRVLVTAAPGTTLGRLVHALDPNTQPLALAMILAGCGHPGVGETTVTPTRPRSAAPLDELIQLQPTRHAVPSGSDDDHPAGRYR
jgi:hypothetical protein